MLTSIAVRDILRAQRLRTRDSMALVRVGAWEGGERALVGVESAEKALVVRRCELAGRSTDAGGELPIGHELLEHNWTRVWSGNHVSLHGMQAGMKATGI